jgi:hypothetical protein
MEASVQLLSGNISEMLGDEGEGDEIGRCSLVEGDSSALTFDLEPLVRRIRVSGIIGGSTYMSEDILLCFQRQVEN